MQEITCENQFDPHSIKQIPTIALPDMYGKKKLYTIESGEVSVSNGFVLKFKTRVDIYNDGTFINKTLGKNIHVGYLLDHEFNEIVTNIDMYRGAKYPEALAYKGGEGFYCTLDYSTGKRVYCTTYISMISTWAERRRNIDKILGL